MLIEVLKARTGMDGTIVTYKGDAPAMTDLLGGQVDTFIGNPLVAAPHIEANKIKPIFMTLTKRSAPPPNVPTAEEAGAEGVFLEFNLGIWAPKGTPRPVIQRLNEAAVATAKQKDVIDQFLKFAANSVGSTPEEQVRAYEAEMRFWQEAVKLTNFKPQ